MKVIEQGKEILVKDFEQKLQYVHYDPSTWGYNEVEKKEDVMKRFNEFIKTVQVISFEEIPFIKDGDDYFALRLFYQEN